MIRLAINDIDEEYARQNGCTVLHVHNFFNPLANKNGPLFGPFYTKNPPQTDLRGIFVEHRRIELLTF